MDTSIRLYNLNSGLRPVLDTEAVSRPTIPLQRAEDNREELDIGRDEVDEDERATDAIASQPQAAEEPVEKVDVADFEAIFLRFQGPITNFIYHLIGNREQAYDLTQDVFVQAYKALLNGTSYSLGHYRPGCIESQPIRRPIRCGGGGSSPGCLFPCSMRIAA